MWDMISQMAGDRWRKKYPRITKKIDDLESRLDELEKFDKQ